MSKVEVVETWVIRHKESGEYFKARSGKSSWGSKSAAKNAWANSLCQEWFMYDHEVLKKCNLYKVSPVVIPVEKRSSCRPDLTTDFPYFDEQDQWETVELNEGLKHLEELGIAQKKLNRVESIIEDHFKEYGVPDCLESLGQCDHYQENLDWLTARILIALGYIQED